MLTNSHFLKNYLMDFVHIQKEHHTAHRDIQLIYYLCKLASLIFYIDSVLDIFSSVSHQYWIPEVR